MFTKFMSIEDEKRERIINAALKEFAAKGFAAASTNEIAKAAGISKGLLFHYFTSKRDLFLYLYDHAIKIITDEIAQKVDMQERDLFVKLRQVSLVKLNIYSVYPAMLEFVKVVFFEEAKEVKEELAGFNKRMLASEYHRLFADIDTSKFKDGIDPAWAMQVTFWSMEGLGEREREKHKLLGTDLNLDELMKEFDRFMEQFKLSFYK